MRIQSAGRLGNNLFIWAYALGVSIETGKRVTIFSDGFHSNLGQDEAETIELLECNLIQFKRSNFLGATFKFLDWLRQYSVKIYAALTFILRIGTESEGTEKNRFIVRGYFQNAEYVARYADQIASHMNKALMRIEDKSQLVRGITSKFQNYQVIHLRLGDFTGTSYGTINASSYFKLLDRKLPIIVCTDGSAFDVARYLDFNVELVVTARESTSWETLAIFSNATRFVGVNSTLSWWGAFVASQNGAEAYLPEIWSTIAGEDPGNLMRINGVNRYQNTFLSDY
jgi:hypothetical protein